MAPDVFSINPDSSGLCDASDCEDVIVEGNMFLDGDGLLCKMQKFQVFSYKAYSIVLYCYIVELKRNILC